MNIEISGRIARTKLLGKQGFEIGIDYAEDAPEYWRECLVDLLPAPGEFDE
jgi:glycine cleavage system aminomethyltransferase T